MKDKVDKGKNRNLATDSLLQWSSSSQSKTIEKWFIYKHS